MASDTQFTFRADHPLRTELTAISSGLGVKLAVLVRDMLAESLPAWRKRAEEEIAKRENRPHGVTPDQLETALESLIRDLIDGEPMHLEPHQMLDPKSKALWTLLGYIWRDVPTPEDRSIAAHVERLLKE